MFSFLAALVASSISQSAIFGPECLAPPPNASEACVQCYEVACANYIKAFFDCDGNATCREVALTVYALRLVACNCGISSASATVGILNPSQQHDAIQILGSWN